MKSESSQRKIILAVDDKLENLKVLIQYLEDSGFELMVAQNGEEALQHIEKIVPDLILLDVLMPGIDGFETCRRLKENKKTKDVPVIFMSALTESVDKIKGFNVGAVDYLTKPLQYEEVLARINTHYTLRKFQQQLYNKNVLLEEKNFQLKKFTDRINYEIDRARKIQQRFLPLNNCMPFSDKINWAFCFEPAEEVGGDYFDVDLLDDDRIAILFSDVCGHGMSAAFITAIIKTTFQAWIDSKGRLEELSENLNANLYRLTPSDSFAAVFLAIYNIKTGKLNYINFGHCPEPWLIPADKDTSIHSLNCASNLLLGIMEKIEINMAEQKINQGETLVFVSDGIIENFNPENMNEISKVEDSEYGVNRFENLLENNRTLNVERLVEVIRNEKNCFADSATQFDDCTVLVLKINS